MNFERRLPNKLLEWGPKRAEVQVNLHEIWSEILSDVDPSQDLPQQLEEILIELIVTMGRETKEKVTLRLFS